MYYITHRSYVCERKLLLGSPCVTYNILQIEVFLPVYPFSQELKNLYPFTKHCLYLSIFH